MPEAMQLPLSRGLLGYMSLNCIKSEAGLLPANCTVKALAVPIGR
jgi:hypothetical protein